MNIQLRIRTDAHSITAIHYIENWLTSAPQGFAFWHNKPGNSHYHVYLFGLERNVDAMRKHLGKHLPNKECYAVGITCGGKKKIPITISGAYQYGTEKEGNPPVWSKGFDDEFLEDLAKIASSHYKPLPIIARPGDVLGLPEVPIYKVDRVWERLSAKQQDYDGITIKAIKSKLAAEWLNMGRAVPRTADLHRYAISLYYLNKFKDTAIPDDALMEHYD